MRSSPFDKLDVRRRLVAAGFSDTQADEVIAIAREMAGDVLATKAEVHALDAATKADIRELELRLTLRVSGMILAACAILAALEVVS